MAPFMQTPKRLWKEMSAPEYLSSAQLDASQLKRERVDFGYTHGRIELEVTLPANGAAAIEFEFPRESKLRGLR
jgi:hypothetical protein